MNYHKVFAQIKEQYPQLEPAVLKFARLPHNWFGAFDHNTLEISLAKVHGNRSTGFYIIVLLHECYHYLQKVNNKPLCEKEADEWALSQCYQFPNLIDESDMDAYTEHRKWIYNY